MRERPPAGHGRSGVYLHFPFCAIRCSYCDFPTVAGHDDRIADYLRALETEIRTGQRGLPREVDSIYLGGGTPSRMTPAQLGRVLGVVRERFRVLPDCEITLEANPESLGVARLAGYRDAGVTRLSIGVQSLDDRVLAGVGRAHDAARAVESVRLAREAGIAALNLDLIAGLPGEDLSRWRATLERVVALEPEHVSVYLLETDKDTPLARGVRHGRVAVVDDDGLAEAYRVTVETLERRGLALYEISNFARPGHESRHNLKYWSDTPYGGFGLGAHAYVGGARRANRRDLDGYLADVAAGRDPGVETDAWNPRRRLEEAMVFGLRRVAGIDLVDLGRRYGADPAADYRAAWDRGLEAELIERRGGQVRLTPAGRLRSNELFVELLTA